jgi:hypothetical protein
VDYGLWKLITLEVSIRGVEVGVEESIVNEPVVLKTLIFQTTDSNKQRKK